MARPTKAQAALVAARRTTALQLRAAGVEPLVIARKLAADPAINSDGVHYPMGYGVERYEAGQPPPSDRKLIIRACQDVAEAVRSRRAVLDTAVDDARDLQEYRLDQMLTVASRMALRGDLAAMDRVIRIEERRSKLRGLDSPTEITGGGGGALIIEIDPGLLPRVPDTTG